MIEDDLFNEVLLHPTNEGANKLYIVSGYATAAMAFHHLEALQKEGRDVKIELLIGMCPNDGLSLSNHRAFQQITGRDFPDNFQCSYVINQPAVHSKIYAWFKDENPLFGYIGSANYTQTAFLKTQREVITLCDVEKAFRYYQDLLKETIYCTHPDSENFVTIYNDKYYPTKRPSQEIKIKEEENVVFDEDVTGLPIVKVSLLDRDGALPQRSGLNWGQRPEEHREPNQAYIRLSTDINKTSFFPPRSVHFTVLTDDSKVLICTRAQENGKAIHTPHNNSLIGEYFRNRLGVPNGVAITLNNLTNYGRSYLTFYKIDNETYFMDFSV